MRQELLSALGGSIVYEECKGDFTRAGCVADLWLTEARRAADASAIADALMWRGVVYLLGGDPVAAANAFTEAECAAGSDEQRQLMVESFRWLEWLERYYTTPDGSSVLSTELSKRFDVVRETTEAKEKWNRLRDGVKSQNVLRESAFIFQDLHNVRLIRGSIDLVSASIETEHVPIGKFNFIKTFMDRLSAEEENGRLSVAGYLCFVIGDLYRRGADLENAEQVLNKAKHYYYEAGDRAGEALCIMTIGDGYCAPMTTPLAWNFRWSERLGDPTDTSRQPKFISPDITALARARECFREAESLFRLASAPRGVAQIKLREGYLAMVLEDMHGALRCAEQASMGFQACGDQRGWATAQTHLIMSRIVANQGSGLDDVARTVARWGDSSGSFSFTLCLGFLLSEFGRHWLDEKGDYQRAITGFEAAHALYETLQARMNSAAALADLGYAYEAVGERRNALNNLRHAADRYEKEDLATLPGRNGLNVAQIMNLMMGLYNLCLQEMDSHGMEHSVALLRSLCKKYIGIDPIFEVHTSFSAQFGMTTGCLPATALTLGYGAEVIQRTMSDENMLDEMKNLIQEQLPSFVRWNYIATSVLSPLYLARHAREAGQDAAANELFKEALRAARKANDQRYYLESLVLAEQKNYEAAAALYGKHVGTEINQLSTLAEGGAHANVLRRQVIRNKHDQAFTMFVRLKDYNSARQHLNELRRIDGDGWWAMDRRPWLNLSTCGEFHEGSGEYQEALHYYDMAIDALEARRAQLARDELKTAFADDKGVPFLYLQAARASVKKEQSARGFDYCEQGKARALLDLMARTADISGDLTEDEILRCWREQSAHLQLLRGLLAAERNRPAPDEKKLTEDEQSLKESELELSRIEKQFSVHRPDFLAAVSRNASTLKAEQVANLLPVDCTLIEYFFGGDDFLAWAIDRNGLKQTVHTPVDSITLRGRIERFHSACSGLKPVETLAGELSALFLEPLTGAIRSAGALIFAPHGLSHKLPFCALPFKGAPLIEHCPTSYLPSASILQFLHREPQVYEAEDAIVVGNPTGNLPYAEDEATLVASLFQTQPLLNGAATKAALRTRLEMARFLHLATHGKVVPEAPLASSIALAGAEKLTVYEMMGLRLRSDLVVLSACDTAQGKNTGGDELIGFSRGLLATGARSAIVSLWPIDDISTRLLMERFYGSLGIGGSGRASGEGIVEAKFALQRAQIWLRNATAGDMALAEHWRQVHQTTSDCKLAVTALRSMRYYGRHPEVKPFASPYYWAPFIFIGA